MGDQEMRPDLDRHHLVLSQSSGEMLGSHSTDLIVERLSDVSVCVAEWVVGDEGRVDLDRHHLVLSQSSGEMLGSHIPDLIRAEVE